jgi:hypothetical protein
MLLRCPNPQCGKENPAESLRCPACGAHLRAYNWLRLLPDYLFNQGLDLAQQGYFQQAERSLHGALLFAARDLETQLLLTTVQALQGHAAAAEATLAHLSGSETTDPRLAGILAALSTEIAASAQPPTPLVSAGAPTRAPADAPRAGGGGAASGPSNKQSKDHSTGRASDRKPKKPRR